MKILIVEDDIRSQKLETALLEHAGHEVLVAESAEAGILLAEEKSPDLIIMDNRLPGMNGEQAFGILMKDKGTNNIPVVFVTASVIGDDRKRLESHDCKVLNKPINTRTFVRDIEEVSNAKNSLRR